MENRNQSVETEKKDNKNSNSSSDTKKESALETAIKTGVAEDPVLSYFYNNRKPILTTLIVLLAGYYIFIKFENSQKMQARQAGGVLYELQELFEVYNNSKNNSDSKEADQEEINKTLSDIKQKILVLKTESEPYNLIANSYSALLAYDNNEYEKSVSFIKNNISKIESDNFYLEVALLRLAKKLSLIKDHKEFAIKNLETLASNSKYVSVSAYKFLEDNNYLEKEKLESIKKSIVTTNPEFASLVE